MKFGRLIALIYAILLGSPLAEPQERSVHVTRLSVVPRGPLALSWMPQSAVLEENFETTSARLSIKNTGEANSSVARFYAEFLDSDGRRCFSFVFSQDANLEHRTGPFRRGEERTLVASAQLAPAAEPVALHLYLVTADQSLDSPIVSGEQSFRIPITIRAWAPKDWVRLPFATRQIDLAEGVASLALARVMVSARGRLMKVDLLHAADPRVAAWAEGFIDKLLFTPAVLAGKPENGETLLLIRLVANQGGVLRPFLARDEKWVQEYVGAAGRAAVPVINELRFESQDSGDVSTFVDIGTDWCLESFHWAPDPVYGGTKRVWNGPDEGEKLTVRPQ